MSVHFLKERKVNFYADRLNITHGYLSSTVKSVSGKTPLDWIEEYVLEHKDTKIFHSAKNTLYLRVFVFKIIPAE